MEDSFRAGSRLWNQEIHAMVVTTLARKLHAGSVPNIVAIEEGTVRVLRPGESPSDSTYLAVHVKKDGQWKLDTVRETEVPEAPAASTPL